MAEPRLLKLATPTEVEVLLPLVEEFYRHFAYPFSLPEKRRALSTLLASPGLGKALFIRAPGGEALGYLLLSFYFSLEYGGITAFVDELFVRGAHRGAGFGTQALREVLEMAKELGLRALHLEAERTNTAAAALYQRLGFHDHDRRLLTLRLPHTPAPDAVLSTEEP